MCGGCYSLTNYPNTFHIANNPRWNPVEPEQQDKWKRKAMIENEYLCARNGDHLLTPFVCDLCVFRKLHKQDPVIGFGKDKQTFLFIRRANLDAFWSRALSTVKANLGRVKRCIADLEERFGIIDAPFYDLGPAPPGDHEGYALALSMLVASEKPGRNCPTHTQWNTVWHIKSSVASFEKTQAPAFAFYDSKRGTIQ